MSWAHFLAGAPRVAFLLSMARLCDMAPASTKLWCLTRAAVSEAGLAYDQQGMRCSHHMRHWLLFAGDQHDGRRSSE